MKKRPTNQSQPSAHEPRKYTAIHFSPRELRVLKHLMASRSPMREVVDLVAGSSNGPDVVARVRRKLNIEIPCDRVPATDRGAFLALCCGYQFGEAFYSIVRTEMYSLSPRKTVVKHVGHLCGQ